MIRLGVYLIARLRQVLVRAWIRVTVKFRLGIYFQIFNMEIEPMYQF